MLTTCRSHENYQVFLKQHLPALFLSDPNRLSSFSNHLAALWLLDLDLAIPYFIDNYSACGRPSVFDPTDLFRSLVLMAKTRKHFGITEWSQALRNYRVLAVLSGFPPHKTPSIGIFYAFLDRFWLDFNNDSKKRRLRLCTVRRMLIAIYHMLKTGSLYRELGSEYYNQFNQEKKIQSYLKKLSALGWELPTIATT